METNLIVDKINAAISFAKDKGYALISEDWGVQDKCACALGCVLVQKNCWTNNGYANEAQLCTLLETSANWINAFISGYDECPYTPLWETNDPKEKDELIQAYSAGIEMKDKLNPIKFSKWNKK